MSKLILIVVLLTIGSRLLGAQAGPSAGAKVRVSSGAGATFVGTLAEWRPDSIVISDSTGRRAFAAHRNTRVEVSRGTRRATLKGAAIGAALVAVARGRPRCRC